MNSGLMHSRWQWILRAQSMEAQLQNKYTGLHVTEVPRAVNFIRQWLVGVGCEGEGWGVFNEDLEKFWRWMGVTVL